MHDKYKWDIGRSFGCGEHFFSPTCARVDECMRAYVPRNQPLLLLYVNAGGGGFIHRYVYV